jgi:Mn2+/Fe2+ NRAMP family transporter
MFTIQAAVTVVTAGLASHLFGFGLSPLGWSIILLIICVVILIIGRYPLLDKAIKAIIILLSLSTIIAVLAAFEHGLSATTSVSSVNIWTVTGISFIVALVGWMPSAIDISVWHSLWSLEKQKTSGKKLTLKNARFDFNVGYFGTAFLALGFLSLGAIIMHGSGQQLSPKGAVFANQLIDMYVLSLGEWSRIVIGIAAFTTMFSTTLTVTDAFPRVLQRSTELIFHLKNINNKDHFYWIWMGVVVIGGIILIGFLVESMTLLVDIATTLSFLTAPFLAYINYRVVTDHSMPESGRPKIVLRIMSWVGIIFLGGFGIFFIFWRFGSFLNFG